MPAGLSGQRHVTLNATLPPELGRRKPVNAPGATSPGTALATSCDNASRKADGDVTFLLLHMAQEKLWC
jgi:hypothetical protein